MKNEVTAPTEQFFALTHPCRVNILAFLSTGPKTVIEIMNEFKIEQAVVSKQINHLYDHGLVIRGKRGRKYVYSLNTDALDEMVSLLTKWKESAKKA